LLVCKVTTLFAMPVRLLTQSVMRLPEPDQVMRQVKARSGDQAAGSRFASELRRDARWVWSRPLSHSYDPAV
jgi:hypothetical protein